MTTRSATEIYPPYSLSKQAQREAWLEWFGRIDGIPCLAITFTHRPGVSDNRRKDVLREFVGIVNKMVFPTIPKSMRGGMKLVLIAINESKFLSGIHHHLTLEIPIGWTPDLWAEFCMEMWMSLTGTGPQANHIKGVKDHGWIEYCMKFRDKEVYGDAVMMDLLHLESAFSLQ